jgi:hypothetical protein
LEYLAVHGKRDDDADEGQPDPRRLAHEVGDEKGNRNFDGDRSEDRGDCGTHAAHAAEGTGERDISLLVAQAPGVKGGANEGDGHHGKQECADGHDRGRVS